MTVSREVAQGRVLSVRERVCEEIAQSLERRLGAAQDSGIGYCDETAMVLCSIIRDVRGAFARYSQPIDDIGPAGRVPTGRPDAASDPLAQRIGLDRSVQP